MARRILLYLKDLLFVLVSSGLLVLSFPNFDLSLLAWVALVPLLLTIHGRNPGTGFFLSLTCGLLFLLGMFNWILEVPGYTFLHHGILALCMGAYVGFFGLTFALICRRCGVTPAFLAAPFLWVSLEYIRSNLSFLAFPCALLAHSQYHYPSIIQFASITGAYGVSFLVVMVNSALALTILAFFSRLRWYKPPPCTPPSRRGIIGLVLLTLALTAMALLHGLTTLSRPIAGQEIKVSVVQGNIEQDRKRDRKYAKFIMQTYTNLTREASEDGPLLIIWPETATPRSISRDPRLRAEVRRIAREAAAYLLLGSSQQGKFGKKGSRKLKYVNSAFLIRPTAEIAKNQRYDKIRLLPFGEYLPLKGIFPWSIINVPDFNYYVPGKEFTVFELPPFRFSATICWEHIFPDLVRRFVKGGAQFIVNITNEAWFGKTAAPYQFLSISVFRAVENRVYVVRCANTGVSCFIDPYGRIVDRIKDAKGKDIFVRGVMSGSVMPLESSTFYTQYGDWLAWLSLPCSVVFLFVAFLRKNQDPRSMARLQQ